MATYAELLKMPEWDEKRKIILKRDNWTCQICNTTNTEMHVHHLWYEDHRPAPWEYENDALITLCSVCHEKEEFHKSFTSFGIKYLTTLGVMHTDISEIIMIISQATDKDDFPGMRDYISRVIKHIRYA